MYTYRVEWVFEGRAPLVRLVRFASDDAAVRATRAPEYYRGIFRRAGLASRTASAFEYTDRFPVPSAVHVRRTT